MIAATVMHVLLSVLHVGMVRECEVDGNAGVGDLVGVVMVSARHECVYGIRGLGSVSNAADVLGISVVR